jgi:hydrogenase/urease accessory protein HupE
MFMRRAIPTTFAAAFVLTPTAALAHAGHGDASGPMNGFSHPITGIDHVLAMVDVGVLAAQLGGRALSLAGGSRVVALVTRDASSVAEPVDCSCLI